MTRTIESENSGIDDVGRDRPAIRDGGVQKFQKRPPHNACATIGGIEEIEARQVKPVADHGLAHDPPSKCGALGNIEPSEDGGQVSGRSRGRCRTRWAIQRREGVLERDHPVVRANLGGVERRADARRDGGGLAVELQQAGDRRRAATGIPQSGLKVGFDLQTFMLGARGRAQRLMHETDFHVPTLAGPCANVTAWPCRARPQ